MKNLLRKFILPGFMASIFVFSGCASTARLLTSLSTPTEQAAITNK